MENYLGFIIISIGEELNMLFSINFLIFISIIGGSILIWLIFPYFNLIILVFYLKLLIIFICLIGSFIGIFFINSFSINFLKINFLKLYFIFFFSNIWFIIFIFCLGFNIFFLKIINNYKFYLDLGWLEYFGGGFFIKYFFF